MTAGAIINQQREKTEGEGGGKLSGRKGEEEGGGGTRAGEAAHEATLAVLLRRSSPGSRMGSRALSPGSSPSYTTRG